MDMIERITVGEINKGINVFYGKNHESWVRGGGPGPEYKDCSLYDFIHEIAPKHGVKVEQENEELDYQMYDMLFDGPETKEGLIAFFYAAAVQATEMRERLRMIEEILCEDKNEFDIDHLQELIQADRDGRCMILPAKLGTHLFVRHKDGDSPVVVESTVVGAHVKDTESYRGAPRKEYIVVRSNGFSKHISVDQIGKTAFFSKEDALAEKRADLAKRTAKREES